MNFKNRIATLLVAFAFVGATFFMPQNVHASTYNGIDVYEHSDITDYQVLKNSGVSVVIQKASQGFRKDGLLDYRANMLNQYGFHVGYYCYANNLSYQSPEAQAQFFLQQVQGLKHDVVLFLDIEIEEDWTKTQAINFTNKFINYVQARGYKIGIYSGQSFYYDYLAGNVPNVSLWLANYSRQPAQFPGLVSWQYTGTGSNTGMSGYVDKDSFNSSIFTGQASQNSSVNVVPQVHYNSNQIIQMQLNAVLGTHLAVDGILGSQSIRDIGVFETVCGLKVDDVWGSQCANAVSQVYSKPLCGYPYVHRISTRIIQYRMGIQFNGVYNNYVANHVRQWQNANGLSSDGLFGNQSWNKLGL